MATHPPEVDNIWSDESPINWRTLMPIENTLRKVWSTVRALSGEDAYERYLAHWREHHVQDGDEPLSREAFFKAEVERKWNGVKRCC